MTGCIGSCGFLDVARRGVILGLVSSLLVGAAIAQSPRFFSPSDEKLFWAMQDELRQISQEITLLGGSALPPEKSSTRIRLGGAAKLRSKDLALRAQQLAALRRRFTTVSLSAMALVIPSAKPKILPKTEPRKLGWQEENLRQLADLRGRVDFWRTGRRALRLGGLRSRYADTIPLDHESLRAFPDHRFYLAKIHVSPQPLDPVPRVARPVQFERFIYQLIVFHHKTGKIRVRYGFGPRDVLRPILDAGEIRAPSNAIAEQIQVASSVLSRASMGANIFRRMGSKGLSQAEIDHHFGLGVWSRVHVASPHGVMETSKERILLTWKLQVDDFGLPQHLVFEWLRFDLIEGRWLGRASKAGPELGRRTHRESVGVRNAITEFARDLLRQ